MISSFIQGGLGNQLFQIAAGLSLSQELGTDYFVFNGQHHLPLQGTNIEAYKNTILKNIKFIDRPNINFNIYNESSFSYSPLPKMDFMYLIGYFQSEKYFENNKKLIKSIFHVEKFDVPKNSVSIHIRKGDYLNFPNKHPTQSFEYYRRALESIGSYSKLYIFSDSPLDEKFSFPNSQFVSSTSDYLDFCLMSSCSHNIICNSTFSWWAAYLNDNENKKVVAPKNWFGPEGPSNWDDIYSKDWTIL